MTPALKKNILIGIAVLAGGLLVWAALYFSQFSSYEDKTYGFSINYPAAWTMKAAPQAGVAVVFVTPKENAMDAFRENVNIAVQDIPPEIASMKAFTDKVIAQMTAVFKNMKVTESKDIAFGNRKGHRVIFVAEKPDAVTIMNVWTIKSGSRAYILTYMAATKRYKLYLPMVEAMVKSFNLR